MQLIINTSGSLLRQRGNRFVVSRDGRQHEYSADKLTCILISTNAQITSNAIQLATRNEIDMLFVDSQGSPRARVWQPNFSNNAVLRCRQLEASTSEIGREVAVDLIRKKLQNQLEFLTALSHRRPEHQGSFRSKCQRLNRQVESLDDIQGTITESRQTIWNLEKSAGRIYFEAISQVLPLEYRFARRSFRPAADGFNAMLNYAYGILNTTVERSCILAKLDPSIGFLHANRSHKPSLVLDMLEPFRIIADKTTVLWFASRGVPTSFFRRVAGGIELSPDGRAAVIKKLNERLNQMIRTPTPHSAWRHSRRYRHVKLSSMIQAQAHNLAHRLLSKQASAKNESPRIPFSTNP